MVRPLRIVSEIVFAVIFIGGLALGTLVWRLEHGTIRLAKYLPDIEAVLSDTVPGMHFKIREASLDKGEDAGLMSVHAYDVRVYDKKDREIGAIQEMVLGFTWRNVLTLTPIPSNIHVLRPSVQLTRFENGRIGFNLESVDEDKKPEAQMPELAAVMARSPRALQEIRIQDIDLHFVDQENQIAFEAKNGLFILNRDGEDVTGSLALDLKAKDFEQPLRGAIVYDASKKITKFVTAVQNVTLEQLKIFVPHVPEELQLTMPFNIAARFVVDKKFQPVGADMRVSTGEGTITYAPYFPEATKIKGLSGTVHYKLADKSLEFEQFNVSFGSSLLSAEAKILPLATETPDQKPDRRIELTGFLENVPVDDLKTYWPQAFAVDPRTWIVHHLRDGVAKKAGVELSGFLKADDSFTLEKLGGKIEFEDVTVDYLPPMPAVTKVDGQATFDPDNFYITISDGDLYNTKVKKADLHITDLSKSDQFIDMNFDLDGPLTDAIRTISSKPLEYAQKLGFSAEQFTGNALTQLHLYFPLKNDLMLDQVEMDIAATLLNVTGKNVIKDLNVSADELAFKADEHQLRLEGKANIMDASSEVVWEEYFGDDAENTTVLTAKGKVSPAVLKGLRLPLDKYFSNTASADVKLRQDRQKTIHVDVDADLKNATLTIPELRAEKKTGTEGNLSLVVTSERGGPTTVSDLNIAWPEFGIKDGSARWDHDLNLQSATLKGLKSGRTNTDIIVSPQDNGIRAVIDGNLIDLSGYWTDKSKSGEVDNKTLDISLRAGTLYLDPDVPLRNAKADLLLQGSDLVRGQIAAQVENGDLLLKQTVKPDGSRDLSLSAKNAGQVFKALDITDTVQGGTLNLSGQSTKDNPSGITGRAYLDNFTVVKAPVLARLINAFSPGGLIELLNGQGLAFSKLKTDFILEKPKTIRFKNGKMTGTSIGLGFKGRVYRDKQEVNLSGTIVPIEGLNKLAGGIPIIGQILTGIKGEGLIGATFKVKGPTDNPDVSVNPLSVLTPGILRSILFEGDDD